MSLSEVLLEKSDASLIFLFECPFRGRCCVRPQSPARSSSLPPGDRDRLLTPPQSADRPSDMGRPAGGSVGSSHSDQDPWMIAEMSTGTRGKLISGFGIESAHVTIVLLRRRTGGWEAGDWRGHMQRTRPFRVHKSLYRDNSMRISLNAGAVQLGISRWTTRPKRCSSTQGK